MQNKNKSSLLFQKLELRGLLKDGVFHTPIDFFAIRKPTYWEELKNSVYVIDFSAKGNFFIISTVSNCASSENLEFEIWFSKSDGNVIGAFSYNRSGQVEKMTEEQIEGIIESLFDPFGHDIVFPPDGEKNKNSKRKI